MKQDILKSRLCVGIVGDSQGSFIGAIHRITVELVELNNRASCPKRDCLQSGLLQVAVEEF